MVYRLQKPQHATCFVDMFGAICSWVSHPFGMLECTKIEFHDGWVYINIVRSFHIVNWSHMEGLYNRSVPLSNDMMFWHVLAMSFI